jgi:hypothetical protein
VASESGVAIKSTTPSVKVQPLSTKRADDLLSARGDAPKRTHRAPKLAVRVSDRSPRKGRGVRITVQISEGAGLIGAPVLRMVDSTGAEYRSMMQPGDQLGEWIWKSGLDVIGQWQGYAYARCGKRNVTAKLPPITVSP